MCVSVNEGNPRFTALGGSAMIGYSRIDCLPDIPTSQCKASQFPAQNSSKQCKTPEHQADSKLSDHGTPIRYEGLAECCRSLTGGAYSRDASIAPQLTLLRCRIRPISCHPPRKQLIGGADMQHEQTQTSDLRISSLHTSIHNTQQYHIN